MVETERGIEMELFQVSGTAKMRNEIRAAHTHIPSLVHVPAVVLFPLLPIVYGRISFKTIYFVFL